MVTSDTLVSRQDPYSKTWGLHDYAKISQNVRFIVIFITTTVLIPVTTILIDVTVRHVTHDRRNAWCSPSRMKSINCSTIPTNALPFRYLLQSGGTRIRALATGLGARRQPLSGSSSQRDHEHVGQRTGIATTAIRAWEKETAVFFFLTYF